MYKKFEDSRTHICLADMIKKMIGKKEKRTNKGTVKQYVAESLSLYNLAYLTFVPNLIILYQVVVEKSLTEDFQMHYKEMRVG